MKFNCYILKVQIQYYLYLKFKTEIYRLSSKIFEEIAWEKLVESNLVPIEKFEELKRKIDSLKDKLQGIQKIERRRIYFYFTCDFLKIWFYLKIKSFFSHL